jgi:hypothetical protein
VFHLIGRWVRDTGRSVVSVVHDLILARAWGDEAILMNRGEIIARGEQGPRCPTKTSPPPTAWTCAVDARIVRTVGVTVRPRYSSPGSGGRSLPSTASGAPTLMLPGRSGCESCTPRPPASPASPAAFRRPPRRWTAAPRPRLPG